MSVTLVYPAKAVGQNDMPFGRDTYVVPSDNRLDRGHDAPTGRRDLGVRTPAHSDAAYRKITLSLLYKSSDDSDIN